MTDIITKPRFVGQAKATPSVGKSGPSKSLGRKSGRTNSNAPAQWFAAAFLIIAVVSCGLLPSTSASLKLIITSILLIPAALIVIVRKKEFGEPKLLILSSVVLGAIWLGWGLIQTVDLPEPLLGTIAPGSVAIYDQYVDRPVAAIGKATDNLGNAAGPVAHRRTISLVPEHSFQTLAKYALAFAIFLCSAIVFRNRETRKVLLWSTVVASSLLAFWGLIQRGAGIDDLLPMVTNPLSTTPFGTYAYKNAGAAAVIPGIAVAIALVLSMLPRQFGQKAKHIRTAKTKTAFPVVAGQESFEQQSSNVGNTRTRKRKSSSGYSRGLWFANPKILALFALLALMLCGVLASLSRGAVLAVAVAILFVAIVPPINRMLHRFAIFAAMVLLVGGCVAGLTNLSSIMNQRADKWSADAFSTDMRWQHWDTCLATIAHHLPSGVGIGSYGNASLTQQQEPSRLWFREAHNQYLETIAELGIPGVILLMALLWICLRACIQLIRRSDSRELNGLGVAGLLLLIAAGFQSFFDFVIVISGVMFVYALLFGAIASAASELVNQKQGSKNYHAIRELPVGLLSIAILLLIAFSAYQSQHELRREMVLNRSEIALAHEHMPTQLEIDEAKQVLDVAIASGHANATLFRRRAMWSLAAYRSELIHEAEKQQLEVPWEQTAPENLFRIIQSADQERRDAIVADFIKTDRMKDLLCSALDDLQQSIVANPLVPQVHLCCAFLSPLTEMSWESWAGNSRNLSLSSPDLLFANGLMGYFAGDHELMVEQWNCSLRVSNNNLKPILELSQSVLPADQLAQQLMPSDRAPLWVTTIRYNGRPFVPWINLKITPELVETAVERIYESSRLTYSQRHQMSAQIYVANKDWSQAAKEWQLAVESDGRDVESRYQLAYALHELGAFDEVLSVCETGSLLNPYDLRFKDLILKAKRALKSVPVAHAAAL